MKIILLVFVCCFVYQVTQQVVDHKLKCRIIMLQTNVLGLLTELGLAKFPQIIRFFPGTYNSVLKLC
jgi:hypothetical protein